MDAKKREIFTETCVFNDLHDIKERINNTNKKE